MNNRQGYQIRRSARAKRVRIIVTVDKVELVAPLRMPEKQIQQFLDAKQAWIETAQNKVQQHADNINSFAPASYQQGVLIPYQGEQYELQVQVTQEQYVHIDFNSAFIAYIPERLQKKLTQSELGEQIRRAIIFWMKQAAAKQALKTVVFYTPLYQLTPRSITIKTQKSRWGSCGIHNDINLNWLLILAPAGVFEYVVIHELCHIEQRNHSAAFWALVAQHCANYQQHRGWLKRYGASLMLGL